jgi:adenylate kinase
VIAGLRIIVLGKQGSGKGTQSQQLAQRLTVPHISTGDMLRAAVRSDSTAAREVKAVMDAGELISDQLVFDLVAERLAAPDARHRGFVLDGFPRSISQAKQLFSLLGDNGVDAAVTIEVPTAEVVRRLSARRVCLTCGRNYQVAQTPQLNEWTCGSCGGQVVRRDDDTEPAIRKRLDVYEKTTRPLLQWFTDEHSLVVVNGLGNPDQVLDALLRSLRPELASDRNAALESVSASADIGREHQPDNGHTLAIDVVIEIPRGSRNKYEYDHERHALRLDRRLFSATVYPADYGFFPNTLAEDGEPLDAMVLLEEPTFPGCWITARPVGVFWTEDEQGPDAKILCVPLSDPRWSTVLDLADIPDFLLSEVRHFFEIYKDLEPGKSSSTTGFEGRDAALGEIAAAQARYQSGRPADSSAAPEQPRV